MMVLSPHNYSEAGETPTRLNVRLAAPLGPALWVAVAINIKWHKCLEHRGDRMTLTQNDRVTFCPRRKEVYPPFLYLEAPNCSLTFEMVRDKLSEIDKLVLGTKGHMDPHPRHTAHDTSHSHISHSYAPSLKLLFLNTQPRTKRGKRRSL